MVGTGGIGLFSGNNRNLTLKWSIIRRGLLSTIYYPVVLSVKGGHKSNGIWHVIPENRSWWTKSSREHFFFTFLIRVSYELKPRTFYTCSPFIQSTQFIALTCFRKKVMDSRQTIIVQHDFWPVCSPDSAVVSRVFRAKHPRSGRRIYPNLITHVDAGLLAIFSFCLYAFQICHTNQCRLLVEW